MQDILSALPALLEQQSDNEDVRRAVVFAVWRHIAGDSLAGRAVPVALEENRLTVAVADRNWQRNLEQLASEMVFRMNFIFGTTCVKFIEFVVNNDALTNIAIDSRDKSEFEAEALDQINEPLRRAADVIADDDLRRKFLLAAGSCLARQQRLTAK